MRPVGKNASQKEFAKLFDGLCGKYARFEIWQDFVWLVACSISNAVDKRFFEKRESRFMEIAKKYTQTEMETFSELYGLMVEGMEQGVQRDQDQDFLGDLYMQLNLGNEHAGQFFTPYSVCRLMAEIDLESETVKTSLEQNGYVSICDPACGAGATLLAAANCLSARGINYQQSAIFVGQDIDYTVGLMCYIQLSLMGCPGYVRIGDTISDPATGAVLEGTNDENTWYTPFFFLPRWDLLRRLDRIRKLVPKPEKKQKKEEAPTIILKKDDCGEQLAGQVMFQF